MPLIKFNSPVCIGYYIYWIEKNGYKDIKCKNCGHTVKTNNLSYKVCCGYVSAIGSNDRNEIRIEVTDNKIRKVFYKKDFGSKIFLTKKEANAKVKVLENANFAN